MRTIAEQASACENKADVVLRAIFGAPEHAPQNIVLRGRKLPVEAVKQARLLVKAELKKAQAEKPAGRIIPAKPLTEPKTDSQRAVVEALRALGGAAKAADLIAALAPVWGADNEDMPRRIVSVAAKNGCIRETRNGYSI